MELCEHMQPGAFVTVFAPFEEPIVTRNIAVLERDQMVGNGIARTVVL